MEQKIKLPHFLALFILAFLAFYWLGLFRGWPMSIWWFDDVLHFLGGFWIAGLFVYLVNRSGLTIINDKFWLKLLLGLGFVALVGVLWEFHEFIADWFAQKPIMQNEGPADTITDLFLDLLGGFFFITICHLFQKVSSLVRR